MFGEEEEGRVLGLVRHAMLMLVKRGLTAASLAVRQVSTCLHCHVTVLLMTLCSHSLSVRLVTVLVTQARNTLSASGDNR